MQPSVGRHHQRRRALSTVTPRDYVALGGSLHGHLNEYVFLCEHAIVFSFLLFYVLLFLFLTTHCSERFREVR